MFPISNAILTICMCVIQTAMFLPNNSYPISILIYLYTCLNWSYLYIRNCLQIATQYRVQSIECAPCVPKEPGSTLYVITCKLHTVTRKYIRNRFKTKTADFLTLFFSIFQPSSQHPGPSRAPPSNRLQT